MSEEEKNPFKKGKKQDGWPEEVLERLRMIAERTDESLDQVKEGYIKWIKTEYECDEWPSEDEDLLVDWAEAFLLSTRSSTVSSSGGNTVTFVGEFVGVDAKSDDRQKNIVRSRVRRWEENQNDAISSGLVGHYEKEGSVWIINGSNGVTQTEESIEEAPVMGIKVGNDYICLMSKAGRPYPPERMGRYAYFLGNEKRAFVNDGEVSLWRVDLNGDCMNMELRVGAPCSIEVRMPTTDNEAYQDILSTNMNFAETLTYTDDFVSEEVRPLLHPFKFWTDEDFVGEMYVPLDEIAEAYDSRKRSFDAADGRKGVVGPIVFTKGTVSRMNTAGRENEYDEKVMSYSLSLTSMGLQSIHGKGYGAEVTGWISSACHDMTYPFTFEHHDERWDYAEKSTILVCGRIGMSSRDGEMLPNIKVLGIFADHRRSRRGMRGGDTSPQQFE